MTISGKQSNVPEVLRILKSITISYRSCWHYQITQGVGGLNYAKTLLLL